jgi:hypothetical protein
VTLARTAASARRQVFLRRRHQEAVASARAICHRAQLQLADSGSGDIAGRGRRLGRWPGSGSKG